MKYLKLIRYKDLLVITSIPYIIRYGFLELQNIPLALSHLDFSLLVISIICIAAGGYAVNTATDPVINSPGSSGKKLSEETIYTFYMILTIIGVGIGFYLSNKIERPTFILVFILVAATLYLYAAQLKKSFWAGNLLLAGIAALVVFIPVIFDLLPVTTEENKNVHGSLFKILADYALFTFILFFLKETSKDLYTLKEDYNKGKTTLPIVLGSKRTQNILITLTALTVVLVIWYAQAYLLENNLFLPLGYLIFLIAGPLILAGTRLWQVKSEKEYISISRIYLWIIFLGVLSLAVITLTIQNNA